NQRAPPTALVPGRLVQALAGAWQYGLATRRFHFLAAATRDQQRQHQHQRTTPAHHNVALLLKTQPLTSHLTRSPGTATGLRERVDRRSGADQQAAHRVTSARQVLCWEHSLARLGSMPAARRKRASA